jgi:polar amino acid transport system substrate-binding protein/cystine transport system substrate-binding protein/membrane-bound lytic murein transglycosylase F
MPQELATLRGTTVGFYAGVSGLDRIALSRFLRTQGAGAVTVNNAADLAAGLKEGRFDAGVSEALTARKIAGDNNWRVEWLPEELGRYSIVFGLWKGDLTLKREMVRSIGVIRRNGELESILEQYDLAPIATSCSPCSL